MDKETRIVFGIEDLVTVRFQCGKCKGEVTQNLNAPEPMPSSNAPYAVILGRRMKACQPERIGCLRFCGRR